MLKYAQEKTGELWGGIRGDMLVTLITLIAAYIASSYDWLRLKAKFNIGNEISIIIYFILAGIALIAGTFFWHFLYSIFLSRKIELDLEFSTKPGRKIFGRYLGMYIYNKSAANFESCSVILKDVKAVGKNWNPPEAINRGDALLWGSKMRDREGKKTIRRNNDDDTLVDILHTNRRVIGHCGSLNYFPLPTITWNLAGSRRRKRNASQGRSAHRSP